MPRIRCHYLDCVFLEDRFCGAGAVEFDPESGCLTFRTEEEAELIDDLDDDLDDLDWDDDDTLYEDDDELSWDDDLDDL